MGSRWRWVVVLIVATFVPTGATFLGAGASARDNSRDWYIAGGWVIGAAVLVLFMYGVVLPLTLWVTGPVRDRIMRAATVSRDFEVLDASYGGINVTGNLNRRIVDGRLELRVLPETIGVEDPAPGVTKTLDLRFRHRREEGHISARDTELLRLP